VKKIYFIEEMFHVKQIKNKKEKFIGKRRSGKINKINNM
jgi:hypothetical protein